MSYERQARWSEKNGIAAKAYKLNKEIAEEFAQVCKQNGESQGKLITEFMRDYIEKKEREESIMKAIYEGILNDNKGKLAIVPAYEDFKESDDYKNMTENEKQDEDDLRDVIKLYLQDFTEIAIKKAMLSEAEGKYCDKAAVERFEEKGGVIAIGETAESYMNDFAEDAFENEVDKEAYKNEYVIEVKNGVVDYTCD